MAEVGKPPVRSGGRLKGMYTELATGSPFQISNFAAEVPLVMTATKWKSEEALLGIYKVLLLTNLGNYTIASVDLTSNDGWNDFCNYRTMSLIEDRFFSFDDRFSIYTSKTKLLPSVKTIQFMVEPVSKIRNLDVKWTIGFSTDKRVDPIEGCDNWVK